MIQAYDANAFYVERSVFDKILCSIRSKYTEIRYNRAQNQKSQETILENIRVPK